MAAADFVAPGVPLSEQAEWRDVQPVADASGPHVVAIELSSRQRDVFRYFRAVCDGGEKSLRALALTEEVIGINPASYHAWSYRWQCLATLDRRELFLAERQFLERVAAVNVKNYQLWNHRRRLAFKLGANAAQEELEFAEQCLAADPKNYHAWAHRQAVVRRFGLWEEELLVSEQLIQDDVRNNSAWSQRIFVVSGIELARDKSVIQREVTFAAQAILRAPHNDSPWEYIRGLAELAGGEAFLADSSQLVSICEEVLADLPSCSPAQSLLADICAARARVAVARGDGQAALTAAAPALAGFRRLQVTDPMRHRFWQFRCEVVERCLASAARPV